MSAGVNWRSPEQPSFSITLGARLSPAAAAAVRHAADDVRSGRAASILLGSHADGAGEETHNKALAQRRVNAVKEELERQGLDSSQVAAVAITF